MSTLLTAPPRLADLLLLLAGEEIPAPNRALLRAALQEARRPTVTWLSPHPGEHHIDGLRLHSDLAGMDAAWCAIAAPGQRLVKAADFCLPGAGHPDVTVRAALKRAAAFLAPFNPSAAAAVRSIRITAGHLVFTPDGKADFITSQPTAPRSVSVLHGYVRRATDSTTDRAMAWKSAEPYTENLL